MAVPGLVEARARDGPDAAVARWLIIAGVCLVAVGLVLRYAPWLLNWFGRLPGDIRVESERGGFYFPITSMVLVSLVASLLIALFRR